MLGSQEGCERVGRGVSFFPGSGQVLRQAVLRVTTCLVFVIAGKAGTWLGKA